MEPLDDPLSIESGETNPENPENVIDTLEDAVGEMVEGVEEWEHENAGAFEIVGLAFTGIVILCMIAACFYCCYNAKPLGMEQET